MDNQALAKYSKANDNDSVNFDTIEDAIEDIRQGKIVIVADDEDRENEGDLVCAADKVTSEIINFMVREGRGLVCLTLTKERTRELALDQMVSSNSEANNTAFTISIDASEKHGVTTGISAADRAKTIQVAIDPNASVEDLRRPGHVFPLEAKKGGVLKRVGQTEASVDLARLAGLAPAGVICEILSEDGTMARRDELFSFAKKHGLKFVTVAQLIAYRLKNEKFVNRMAIAELPTAYGKFQIYGYMNDLNKSEHIALVKGNLGDNYIEDINHLPLVRMHSECLTGDVLHSLRCDCGNQLASALQMIDEHGCGALVYLRTHEGRGIGLNNKIKAYALQDDGLDTVQANEKLGFEADLRDYGVGAQILLDLRIENFNLITNNPRKIVGLQGYGLNIVERIPLVLKNKYNAEYLKTKRDKMDHLM